MHKMRGAVNNRNGERRFWRRIHGAVKVHKKIQESLRLLGKEMHYVSV